MSKNRGGGGCIFLHLNFSSRVPREVTDKACMNSENSMRPSCRVTKGGERGRKWPRDRVSILLHTRYTFMGYLLFFHDVLVVFSWKLGQTFAPSQLLFLPCTWLSPEAEICHLWSLGRWMLLAHSLKVIAHKQPLNNWGQRCFIFFLWSASWMGMAHDSVRRGRKHPALTLKSSQLFENPTHWILSQKRKISNYTHIIVAFSVLQWGHTLCSGEKRLNDNQIKN